MFYIHSNYRVKKSNGISNISSHNKNNKSPYWNITNSRFHLFMLKKKQ